MTCMAVRAGADRTVGVRPPDRVALDTSTACSDRPFEHADRVRVPVHRAGVILLGKRDLLRLEIARSADCRPRRRRMPAPKELAILRRMALRAIRGGQVSCDREAAVV